MNSVKKARNAITNVEGVTLHARQPRRRRMEDVKVDDNTVVHTPREIMRREFSSRLKRAIRQKNWRAIDLARAADIGRDSVSSYLRGRMLPSEETLNKIAKALRMDPSELMPSYAQTLSNFEKPFEIWETHAGSGKMWIKINREVTAVQASKIIAVLTGG